MGMIANKYASSSYQDVVAAIELLNEPEMSELSGGRGATQAYYQNGFNTVRDVSETSVVIHDGFVDASAWNGFLTGNGAAGAIVDHHEYQVFTNDLVAMSAQEHVDYVCTNAQTWAGGQDKFLIVGEWTAAMTDCAPALVCHQETLSIGRILTSGRTDMASAQDMTVHTQCGTPTDRMTVAITSDPVAIGILSTNGLPR